MRKSALCIIAILGAACATPPGVDLPSDARSNADPAGEVTRQLRLRTNRSWTAAVDPRSQRIMHLAAERRGAPQLSPTATWADGARAFLVAQRDLLGLRDPQRELDLTKSSTDAFGAHHVRFQQVSHGLRVEGGDLAVHVDREGRLSSIDTNYVQGVDGIPLEPRLSAADAREIAIASALDTAPDVDPSTLEVTGESLVIHGWSGAPALAYKLNVRAVQSATPAVWVTTVDACSGAILERYNGLAAAEGSSRGVSGASRKFQVRTTRGGYEMVDDTRKFVIRTFDAANGTIRPANPLTSTSLTSWDDVTPGRGAAVDLHANAELVVDHFEKHGVTGDYLHVYAHWGQNLNNSFWDFGQGYAVFGDSDGTTAPWPAAFDAVAHEFVHGVTYNSSGLIYQGEAGALNESISDVLAVFAEHDLRPNETANWRMFEDIYPNGGFLRDLRDPALGDQPAHYSKYVETTDDSGGVHTNSGIPNNAAYLMTVGGRNPVSKVEVKVGIGYDKAETLWIHWIANYLLSRSNFDQAAATMMEAAKDLAFTQNELNIVECAWIAVGLADRACGAIEDPRPAPKNDDPTASPDKRDPETETADDPTASNANAPSNASSPMPAPKATPGCQLGSRAANDAPFAALVTAAIAIALRRRRSTTR